MESYKILSHRARRSGEPDSRKNSDSTKLGQRPWIFVKLSFRDFCDSMLPGFPSFDIWPYSVYLPG